MSSCVKLLTLSYLCTCISFLLVFPSKSARNSKQVCPVCVRHFESSDLTGLSSFDRFDHDVRTFSLVHNQAFVLLLYKRDTTRMVGRQLHCTQCSHVSLKHSIPTCIQYPHPNSLHIPTQPHFIKHIFHQSPSTPVG